MYDVVFLHPPASFAKCRFPLGGLFESATGTTDLLTMAPLGMLSLANELARAGRRVAFVNLGKVVAGMRDDPPAHWGDLLRPYPARVYAIGLHWAAHASGAMELARLCKRCQPDARVLLGGLSATYFCDEILAHQPAVDAVALGECDGWMGSIADALLADPIRPEGAANLAYRRGGEIARSPSEAADLTVVDYLDTHGLVHPAPDRDRMEREALLASIPVVRGCNQECLFCGGSRSAYRSAYGRDGVELVPVDVVLDHFQRAAGSGMAGVKLFGDLRLGGASYQDELIAGLSAMPEKLDLYLELFWPADRAWLQRYREVAADMHLSLSPESAQPELRRLHGKRYPNQALIDLARDCRELDIGAWFFFTYLLPGHTPDLLAGELTFLDELLRAEPEVAAMALPYLFMDPAAPLFERPEAHGFEITFRTLGDIIDGMERAYWLHSIGYRTPAFDEAAFHGAILDMTAGQARLYHQTGRMSARDLLRTHTNLACHRELAELLVEQPDMSDEQIQAAVERTFPEPLRRSNASLLLRTFLGEERIRQPRAGDLIHDAFPWALEFALRARPDEGQRLAALIDGWHREREGSLPAFLESPTLPEGVRAFVSDLLAPAQLDPGFVADLLAFEWDLYRLLDFATVRLDGASWGEHLRVKRYGHDLTDLDELLAGQPPDPTWFVFDLARREVFSANFDPKAAEPPPGGGRVRKLSTLGRRLVRTDPALGRILARAMGVSDPGKPATVWSGDSISLEELDALLHP